jgi:hypothetical protein
MEHDDMASKDHKPQVPERLEPPKDSRPDKERLPQGAPSLLNDRLELVRDSHC